MPLIRRKEWFHESERGERKNLEQLCRCEGRRPSAHKRLKLCVATAGAVCLAVRGTPRAICSKNPGAERAREGTGGRGWVTVLRRQSVIFRKLAPHSFTATNSSIA